MAIQDNTKALAIHPKLIMCYQSRAIAYEELGDNAKVAADRRRFIEMGGTPQSQVIFWNALVYDMLLGNRLGNTYSKSGEVTANMNRAYIGSAK